MLKLRGLSELPANALKVEIKNAIKQFDKPMMCGIKDLQCKAFCERRSS